MKMKKLWAVLLLLLSIVFVSTCWAGNDYPFKVIVNKNNPVSSLSVSQIAKIFLKKQTNWENGRIIIPVDLVLSIPTRDSFSETIHGKSARAIKSYWHQQIFSGKAVQTIEKESESDMVSFVKSNTDAIGYVSDMTDTSGVKTIEITH